MQGLSNDIKLAIDTSIELLNSEFQVEFLEEDKMRKIMASKVDSFESIKKLLDRWIKSPNSPNKVTIQKYFKELINAGERALGTLRKGLSASINTKDLPPEKHGTAAIAKPIILDAILKLDEGINELKVKLEADNFTLEEIEFRLGYPEKFARGEFMDVKQLWRTPLDGDRILICPHGTKGEEIVISDLPIILPKPPKDKKQILFHDLPKKDQYWRRTEPPKIDPDNVDVFADFIKEEFRRRVEGVFFYNDGKIVYLTGHHYFHLQYFRMLDDGQYPGFRYAQLHMFYHMQACIVDPRCLGQLFGKSRRTGFTYCALAILLNWSTMKRNSKYGMMSKTSSDCEEAFAKYAYALRSLPFYFRPIIKGKEDSTSHFEFSAPADSSKEAKKQKKGNINDYLNTMVDYRDTSDGAYDSVKLDGYLLDELYKFSRPNNVITHLGMVRPTMMPNGRVVGKMFAGSTMGPHDKGGLQGIELINNSQVKDRDLVTGKTITGLYFHFLPAQENMDEFTDIHGYCHVTKPSKKTYNILGEEIKIGSLEYLLAIEAQLKKQSDLAFNEQCRTYPRTVEHMMRDEATNCIFNLTKITDQIDYNNTVPEHERYVVGNFDWTSYEDGPVTFYPRSDGRFKVSWLPSAADGTEQFANNVEQRGDKFYPLNSSIRFGCDPFSLKSTHSKGSRGGLHGKTTMFTEGGIPSNMFVVEYIARPPDDTIFFEDVIKCIRYYGASILVESNRIDLLRHLRNRGYRPFAMNRLDKPTDKLNPNELEYGGQTMSGQDILDSHLNSLGVWIERYVGVSMNPEIREEGEMGNMVFNETLQDWSKFDPKNRTDHDATISSGLAIMACQTEKYKGVKKAPTKKIVNFVKRYDTSGDIGRQIS